MELIHVMETITVVVTVMMFMCGIPPCLNMYRSGSTRNVPFHMFLLGSLGCLGMLHYGLMLNNATLVFLNAVGSVLQILYCLVYLLVSNTKVRPVLYVTVAVLYELCLYGYLYTVVVHQPALANTLGMMSSAVTTIIVCCPAIEVVHNIRHQNTDGMPLVMLLGGMACGCCWLIYGMMLGDPNIYSPNIPGIAVNLAKLSMFGIFGTDKAKTA